MLAMEDSASIACARVMRGHQFHGEERYAAVRQFGALPDGGQRFAKTDQNLALT